MYTYLPASINNKINYWGKKCPHSEIGDAFPLGKLHIIIFITKPVIVLHHSIKNNNV